MFLGLLGEAKITSCHLCHMLNRKQQVSPLCHLNRKLCRMLPAFPLYHLNHKLNRMLRVPLLQHTRLTVRCGQIQIR
jgi:hypothetical protein